MSPARCSRDWTFNERKGEREHKRKFASSSKKGVLEIEEERERARRYIQEARANPRVKHHAIIPRQPKHEAPYYHTVTCVDGMREVDPPRKHLLAVHLRLCVKRKGVPHNVATLHCPVKRLQPLRRRTVQPFQRQVRERWGALDEQTHEPRVREEFVACAAALVPQSLLEAWGAVEVPAGTNVFVDDCHRGPSKPKKPTYMTWEQTF